LNSISQEIGRIFRGEVMPQGKLGGLFLTGHRDRAIEHEESPMTPEIQIGTILMSEWPQPFVLESQPYSGNWSVVNAFDGFALDRKIRAAGWNFFFIASELKATFFGVRSARNIQKALQRILGKVSQQHFNGVEVTGIVAKRFLGIPYTVVSAHSRHLQQNCYLDDVHARRRLRQHAA
jgi:hypothetical protein